MKPILTAQLLNFSDSGVIGFDVFNAVNIKHKKSESRRKLDLPKDSRIILFVGRFVDVKGFYDLVESSLNINKKYQDIVYLRIFKNRCNSHY